MEWFGIRPHDEMMASSFLMTLHPFGVGARIVSDVGAEGGKDPVRKENPFHAGNLPECAN